MNRYSLQYTDPDDVNDVLEKLERSFGILFPATSPPPVTTLGGLIDWLDQALPVVETADCSSQQAFYKVRAALANVLSVNPAEIRPNTALADLIPPAQRRQRLTQLNHELGITSQLLVAPSWLITCLLVCLFGSFVALNVNWPVALAGVFLSALGLRLATQFANTFVETTVGDLVRKLSREHYRAMRRTPSTVSRRELEPVVMALFSHELGIPRHYLTRDAVFIN